PPVRLRSNAAGFSEQQSGGPTRGAGHRSDQSWAQAQGQFGRLKTTTRRLSETGTVSKSPRATHRPATTGRGGGRTPAKALSRLAGHHYHFDGGFDVAVQLHSHVELPHIAQRAFRHTYFALLQLHASGGDGNSDARGSGGGISDVAGTDGAEQLAFLTGVSGDGDGQISQLGCTGFSLGSLLGSDLLQLSATRFEGFDVGGSGRCCLTERQQEIASIARLH